MYNAIPNIIIAHLSRIHYKQIIELFRLLLMPAQLVKTLHNIQIKDNSFSYSQLKTTF